MSVGIRTRKGTKKRASHNLLVLCMTAAHTVHLQYILVYCMSRPQLSTQKREEGGKETKEKEFSHFSASFVMFLDCCSNLLHETSELTVARLNKGTNWFYLISFLWRFHLSPRHTHKSWRRVHLRHYENDWHFFHSCVKIKSISVVWFHDSVAKTLIFWMCL